MSRFLAVFLLLVYIATAVPLLNREDKSVDYVLPAQLQSHNDNARRGLSLPSTLSDSDRQKLLAIHNKIRSETARGLYFAKNGKSQKGANVNELQWSRALEAFATHYASQCVWKHSNMDQKNAFFRSYRGNIEFPWKEGTGVGENLAGLSRGQISIDYLVERISSGFGSNEAKKYNFADGLGNYLVTGHYTQVVWDNVEYVGCGFNVCQGKAISFGVMSCSYWRPGNYNRAPYEAGNPCSKCPSDRNRCVNGLCSKGGSAGSAPQPAPRPQTAPRPTTPRLTRRPTSPRRTRARIQRPGSRPRGGAARRK